MLTGRKEGQWYVEPFAGGMNSLCQVDGNRLACDTNKYLIALWVALQNGWLPPEHVTKEQYYHVWHNMDLYPVELVGWCGFNCSYSGKFFSGYAGDTVVKNGSVRRYQVEARANVLNQLPNMSGVELFNCSYEQLSTPANSIIYCDPPYAGTYNYRNPFDSSAFFDWCRTKNAEGHLVFVSEYEAPSDFSCIWQADVKSSLSANGVYGASKTTTEKLFVLL